MAALARLRLGGWSFKSTVVMVLSTPFVAWAWIGFIEWVTLADNVESNHITAAFRRLLDESPELTLLILLAITAVNAGVLGVILGHIWNRWGKTKPRKKGW